MTKPFSNALALCVALALGACASPYQKFYHANTTSDLAAVTMPYSGEPTLGMGTNNPRQDVRNMFQQGYVVVGWSSFVGPAQAKTGAIAQAKAVGAERVLLYSKYRNTITSALPVTLPTATTSYSSGTVNAYGSGGYGVGNYSGMTTTYGTETTYIPYSVDKYDQMAVYFAPRKREGLGILSHNLTDAERQAIGSNVGMEIVAVRTGSPAFQADIIPGDLLLSLDGMPVYDTATMQHAVTAIRGREVAVVLFRGRTKITKSILVPEGTW